MQEQPAALPRAYNPTSVLPPAVDAYTRKFTQNAVNNRTYNPGETCIIQIPAGRPSCWLNQLNSYLRFTVNGAVGVVGQGVSAVNNSRGKFAGLAGASSVIDSIRVYINGSTASELLNYPEIAELYHDATCGGGRANVLDTMQGAYHVVQLPEATPAVTGEEAVTAVYQAGFNASATAAAAANIPAWSATVSLPILDGLLGVLGSKMLPTCLFAPNSIELHITFSSVNNGLSNSPTSGFNAAAATAQNWTITNMAYCGQEVYLPSAVSEQLLASVPAGLALYTNSIHNYVSSAPTQGVAGVWSPQIILGTNYASVNSIFFTFQDLGNMPDSRGCAARRRKPCQAANPEQTITAQLQIGSERVPQVATSGDSQLMAELMQAFGMFTDKDAAPGAQLAGPAWRAVTMTQTGSFAIGYDLDTFSLENDQVRSGRSLVGQQTLLALSSIDSNVSFTMQTYIHHDTKVVIRPGSAVSIYW